MLQTVGLHEVRLAEIAKPVIEEKAEVVEQLPPVKGNHKKPKAAEKPKKSADKNYVEFDFDKHMPALMEALAEAESMINRAKSGQSKVREISLIQLFNIFFKCFIL